MPNNNERPKTEEQQWLETFKSWVADPDAKIAAEQNKEGMNEKPTNWAALATIVHGLSMFSMMKDQLVAQGAINKEDAKLTEEKYEKLKDRFSVLRSESRDVEGNIPQEAEDEIYEMLSGLFDNNQN